MASSRESGTRFCRQVVMVADALREMVFAEVIRNNADLTLRQCTAIKIVGWQTENRPEGMTLKELAAWMELTPGTVSEMVETLVQREIFQRETHPADRRKVLIRMSPECRAQLAAAEEQMGDIAGRALSKITVADREKVLGLLGQISKQLAKLDTAKEKK